MDNTPQHTASTRLSIALQAGVLLAAAVLLFAASISAGLPLAWLGLVALAMFSRKVRERCFSSTVILISLLCGGLAAAEWISRMPNQVARQRLLELNQFAPLLVPPCIIPILFWCLTGFVAAALVRSIRLGSWRRFALILVTGVVSLIGMVVCALVVTRVWIYSDPPPLGVGDYIQYTVVDAAVSLDPPQRRRSDQFDRIADLSYGPHKWRNTMDLYLPKERSRALPVVVYIHGGGWADGDKSLGKEGLPFPWLHALLARNVAVASLNHRFTWINPNHASGHEEVAGPFPAQIRDCFAAIRFLRANAGKYQIDPDHIGVMGHSSGGHLAALVGVASEVPEFQTDSNSDVSSRVQAVAILAGVTDIRVYEKQQTLHLKSLNYPIADYLFSGMTNDPVPRLLSGSVANKMELAKLASPTTHVSKDDPPVLLIHGFRDAAVAPHQSEQLHCLLRTAGVRSQLHLIPGAGHPLADYPQTADLVAAFMQTELAH